MKFVLFRHAHKGILPFEDPELSPQGFEQALRISNLITNNNLKNNLSSPTHLYASPKKRTSQTLYPTSQKLKLKIEIHPALDQQSQHENNTDFKKRVQKFLFYLESLNRENFVIFACSHYDWIEVAMTLISSDKDLNSFEFSHWEPTQYIEFELQDNLWKFIQKGAAK